MVRFVLRVIRVSACVFRLAYYRKTRKRIELICGVRVTTEEYYCESDGVRIRRGKEKPFHDRNENSNLHLQNLFR